MLSFFLALFSASAISIRQSSWAAGAWNTHGNGLACFEMWQKQCKTLRDLVKTFSVHRTSNRLQQFGNTFVCSVLRVVQDNNSRGVVLCICWCRVFVQFHRLSSYRIFFNKDHEGIWKSVLSIRKDMLSQFFRYHFFCLRQIQKCEDHSSNVTIPPP